MKKMYTERNLTCRGIDVINHSICTKCKGRCCKYMGCHFSPTDFNDLSFEGLKKELKNGYISISCICLNPISSTDYLYFLRVRNLGSPIVDVNIGEIHPCILLGKSGCKLSDSDRPLGGKLLVPTPYSVTYPEDILCDNLYSLQDCAFDWKPYTNTLLQLIQFFKGKNYVSIL